MREIALPVPAVTAEAYEDGERPRRLHHAAVPSEYTSTTDAFAPFKGEKVCMSRSGRWRAKHTPDGGSGRGGRVRCVFCDSVLE